MFQRFIGDTKLTQRFIDLYVRPQMGCRLLDLGCGPGDLIDDLPQLEYVGVDVSAKYIETARRQFGRRAQFHCQTIMDCVASQLGSFDIVVAKGVLHHLDDDEAAKLFQLARAVLRPKGRLVTIDGCYVQGQSRLTQALLSRDRGNFVRWRHEYEHLARKVFPNLSSEIRWDLTRIPWTHLVLQCHQDAKAMTTTTTLTPQRAA
jgi:2-polyprenyl-3-methyl-5-hydroxy-6-metoxy-1,4-benzoquinol methylase